VVRGRAATEAQPLRRAALGLVSAHEDGAVIGINDGHSDTRQRFSAAHELGHFLLGHHERSSSYEQRFHIDISEGSPPGFDWRAERAANDFAADLLMPRRLIAAEFQQSQDPTKPAARFHVSEIAMGYRLVNLGLR
jgi:Zn-dependent peptidase ImmA (M78 family)